MLSHVYALKDIMTAIQAAGIIVNDYGVTDYQLESEGASGACNCNLMPGQQGRWPAQLVAALARIHGCCAPPPTLFGCPPFPRCPSTTFPSLWQLGL